MRGDDTWMNVSNRPALEGEELVAHKFRSGLIGMVSRTDYSRWKISSQAGVSNGGLARVFRSLVNTFLRYLIAPGLLRSRCDPSPVIAVPADALLRVYGICPDMQRRHGSMQWRMRFLSKSPFCWAAAARLCVSGTASSSRCKHSQRDKG